MRHILVDYQANLKELADIPVEGKSKVCMICMKYRIIILIIIIITLGKILSSYIANTSRTRTLAHTHTPPTTTVAVRCVGAPNHDSVMVGRTLSDAGESGQLGRWDSFFFREYKHSRPNWDAISWQDVLSDDTIS